MAKRYPTPDAFSTYDVELAKLLEQYKALQQFYNSLTYTAKTNDFEVLSTSAKRIFSAIFKEVPSLSKDEDTVARLADEAVHKIGDRAVIAFLTRYYWKATESDVSTASSKDVLQSIRQTKQRYNIIVACFSSYTEIAGFGELVGLILDELKRAVVETAAERGYTINTWTLDGAAHALDAISTP